MLGKFRGIEFHIKDYSDNQGVKTAEADFMAADSKSQVLELENTDFHINGFIYGIDVENTRLKLKQAIKKKTGLLVLPTGESLQVQVCEGGCNILADDELQGYYKLEFNFKAINADSKNLKIIELKEIDEEKLKTAKNELQKSILADFDDKFTFEGFPNFVKMQSFDTISSIAGKVSKLTADNLLGQITNPFTGSMDILASAAGGIGGALMSYLNFKKDFGDKDYFDTYIATAKLASGISAPEVKDEALWQVYRNAIVTEQLVNQTALVEAINEAATNKDYDNQKQIDKVVEVLQSTTEKVTFATANIIIANQLHHMVNMAITLIRKKNAANIINLKFNQSFPAIVIAHQLYGADSLETKTDKLLKRNEVKHALFCPAGQEMEVEDV